MIPCVCGFPGPGGHLHMRLENGSYRIFDGAHWRLISGLPEYRPAEALSSYEVDELLEKLGVTVRLEDMR